MNVNNIANAYGIDSEGEFHPEGERIWIAHKYGHTFGRVIETTHLPEGQIVISASEPMHLFNNISKGNVFTITVSSSSFPEVQLPEFQWFIDKTQEVIIYSIESKAPANITWVESKPQPPTWADKEKYTEAFEKIGQFANMEANWDSYGAKAISKDCISKTIDILNRIIELREDEGIYILPPFIAPLSDGGIQLEWERESRYLEISISYDSTINCFVMDDTSEGEISIEGSIKSFGSLKRLISWFIYGTAKDLEALHDEIGNLIKNGL
jgi:hypothetical protein